MTSNPTTQSRVAEPADELAAYEKALASYLDADVMSADTDVATEAFMNGWNSGRAALAASQAASHSAPAERTATLFEHDDGRYAVSPGTESPAFTRNDPAWHRVGPVDVSALAPAEPVAVAKALRRAFSLGQTYWQQADSESYSQNRKSEETRAKFDALVAEVCATTSTAAPRAPVGAETVAPEALKMAIDALEILDRRPRPMCRDCADEDGTCPSSGLPCDMGATIRNARDALATHPAAGAVHGPTEAPVSLIDAIHALDIHNRSAKQMAVRISQNPQPLIEALRGLS